MKRSKFWGLVFLIFLASFAGLSVQVLLTLPKVETLDTYAPSETTIIFASDETPLARFHDEENRRVIPLSAISPYMLKAVVAIEDERFYSHNGIDFEGMLRALGRNFLYGKIVEGGSTITQQLARNLYLTRKKSITRKAAEIILALQIERRFTKDEILEYYLNQIYFGHNAYGIESASLLYFNKHAKDLNLAEASILAGIIEGPELYSPFRDFKEVKQRQSLVLGKLVDLKMISVEEARSAYQENITLHTENLKKLGKIAPYFVNYIFQDLINKYGENMVTKGGLRVYTTLDPSMQIAAEDAVSRFVNSEGPKYRFTQAALIAIDPKTGGIRAMVGGANFAKSQFNRSIQAKRQPGSSFKPFVYVSAIEQGISPGTVLTDKPLSFRIGAHRIWSPKNFDRQFHGNVTMQQALEKSYNIPAIELLQKVGVGYVISMAQRMGIASKLNPTLSLALGASEVSLYEMVSAFSTFANNGTRVDPIAISKILDKNGNLIYKAEIKEHHILDANVAAIMDDMMEGVIARGTGVRGNIGRPAAAKTGTSQNYKDAWFIGFTPDLAAGVWVGNDNNRPMRGVAEVAVCPRMWKDFMVKALANTPAHGFPEPKGLTSVKVCLISKSLANDYCPKDKVVSAKYFGPDLPKTECNLHSASTPLKQEEDEPIENDEIQEIKEEIQKDLNYE